jgi:Tfp pilus tip-associated adhesin PilY1
MDRRKLGIFGLFALVVALAAPAARAQDDTALFTAAVPPNVLLVVDTSGSMREIMYHPAYEQSSPNACAIFGIIPPNAGGPVTGSANLNDQMSRATPYNCDANTQHCRFQITQGAAGFVTTSTVTCRDGTTTRRNGYIERTFCGRTRKLYVDALNACEGNNTWYSEDYLEWLFGSDADPYWVGSEGNTSTDPMMLDGDRNGTYFITGQRFPLYKRTRIIAAREIARDVIYQTNTNCAQGQGFPCPLGSLDRVRFGLAQFDGGDGGFVRVPIDTYSNNAGALETGIGSLDADASTPLAETLFKIYTYFMQRTSGTQPFGVSGTVRFPRYQYNTTTGANVGSGSPPADPLRCPGTNAPCKCQRNFTILITDGYPNRDEFALNGTRTVGFDNFQLLIGDYHDDGEEEEPAGVTAWRYLDDVTKYMALNDFRLDLEGRQTIETYTVGFNTDAVTNEFLARAATNGGGLFFTGTQAQELTDALVTSISDIIEKSQSFTAATVPATRTSDGGNLYTSLFVPSEQPYWEGRLKLFQITSGGDILDANGNCALVNPMPPGECKRGQVSVAAQPFWDAGEEIPAPDSRKLLASLPGSGRVAFDTSLEASALGDPAVTADDLTLADIALYGGSGATTVEELADEIVQNVRGCEFGTGVSNACVRRPWLLGDIFHSNPLVVGRPRSFINDLSYRNYQAAYATRDSVIYAGSNGGFLHGFLTGEWQTTTIPPGYDRGTGEELFGFMPWPVRRNARHLPLDIGARDYYGVDGTPAAADVWFYSTPTQVAKATDGSEWRTVLAGGLRQGGNAYYALDVTDPSSPTYPGYLWEFPAEDASAADLAAIGETWGTPILTKVQVEIGGAPYERWVAIVTGGYARNGDPNDPTYDAASTAGRGIYILDVQTGEILGEKRFNASATDGRQEMRFAMPSTPSVFDLDQDGYADVIYVGDLGGNVWKWVIKYDPLYDNALSDPVNSTGDVRQPDTKFRRWFAAQADATSSLDVTVNGVTYYKSIFFSPAGAFAQNRFWLAFGTGERALLSRTHDASSTEENNRFYSVKDEDPLDRRDSLIPMITEEDLADQSDDATCPNLASQRGFFFRVADDEKFVTDTDIFSYWVITSTFTPSNSLDPCSAGGDASLYIFKLFCGQGFFYNTSTYSEGSGSLPGGGPGGSGGISDASLPDYGDPASRRIELGAGMPTDPRVTVSPDGTRIVITQQDGEIENWEGPEGGGSAPGQLYWREVTQ